MTQLTERILRLAQYKRKYPYQEILDEEDVIREQENVRLLPLITKLAECASSIDTCAGVSGKARPARTELEALLAEMEGK